MLTELVATSSSFLWLFGGGGGGALNPLIHDETIVSVQKNWHVFSPIKTYSGKGRKLHN